MKYLFLFSEIFSTDDAANPWIFMKGVSSSVLQSLIEFVYCGEVEIDAELLSTFLETADDLKIRGLTQFNSSGVLDNLVKDDDTSENIEMIDEVYDEVTDTALPSYDEADPEDEIIIDNENTQTVVCDGNTVEINAELDKQIEETLVKHNGMWTCKVCGKFANHKSKLKQHVETHIEGFSHPCSLCGKSYRSRNVLRMHLSRDHRNKKISPSKMKNMHQ